MYHCIFYVIGRGPHPSHSTRSIFQDSLAILSMMRITTYS